MLDHNTISAKRWIDKNLRTGFLICTQNFQPLKKSHFKEIQKHQYLLLSDPNFENQSIGMLKRQNSFFSGLIIFITQVSRSLILSYWQQQQKFSKNNLTMCMFRPNIVFVEIAKHQNTMITECTITAKAKGVRKLKHKKEEFEDTKGVIRIH